MDFIQIKYDFTKRLIKRFEMKKEFWAWAEANRYSRDRELHPGWRPFTDEPCTLGKVTEGKDRGKI